MAVKLHPTWLDPLRDEFAQDYMAALRQFLVSEKAAGKQIFPPANDWFRALDLTPLDQVRVVILGQDPYHGAGQAHGLCFSVRPGTRTPPSLVNIYKEMEADLGVPPARHGFLEHWAEQGVLLLNAVLTVEMGLAASHQGRGWERFTDAVIRLVNARDKPVVFMLWGSHAQKKAAFVDSTRASRAALAASLAAVGAYRLFRQQAVFQGQCVPRRAWRKADRLGAAALIARARIAAAATANCPAVRDLCRSGPARTLPPSSRSDRSCAPRRSARRDTPTQMQPEIVLDPTPHISAFCRNRR